MENKNFRSFISFKYAPQQEWVLFHGVGSLHLSAVCDFTAKCQKVMYLFDLPSNKNTNINLTMNNTQY